MPRGTDPTFRDEYSWEDKAKTNPLFAVMAVEEFEEKSTDPSEWTDEDLDRFFTKGQAVYDDVLRPVIQELSLNRDTAFIVEYGSGMGRILKAVSRDGFKVAGIDISPTMLEFSRELVPEIVDLKLLNEHGKTDLSGGLADFVYSYAVVQHIPQLTNVHRAIAEMCRILKPGGTLKFQTLTPRDGPRRQRDAWVQNFEEKSLAIRWYYPLESQLLTNSRISRLVRWLPSFPILRPHMIIHTNWVGIPLTYANIRQFLKINGVRVLGIEKLDGHDNMVWVLGQKDS